MPTPAPSIMRLVLFVLPNGAVRPAIIYDVHSDICVSLSVFVGAYDTLEGEGGQGFSSNPPVIRVTSVLQDQEGKAPRTWHWNDHQLKAGPSH